MNDQELLGALWGKVKPEIYRAFQERLEQGEGSAPAFGCAGREADKQPNDGSAAQIAAVAPGEARDALEWAMVQAFNAAVDREKRARLCGLRMHPDGESHHKSQAARFRRYHEVLATLIPKPDSEAAEQRSGRRNTQAQARPADKDHE